MATYGPANGGVQALIEDLMSDHYPDLVETEAEIKAVFAYPTRNKFGMEKAPAVSQYGISALAKVKINSEADRIEGKPDATIFIDQPAWERLGEDVRRSLVDRCLYSLAIKKKKGHIQTDDRGRPKFKTVKPDWLISGYVRMADRHKENAIEVIQARQLQSDHGQLLFGFVAQEEVQEDLPGVKSSPRKSRKAKGAAAVSASNR